MMVECTTETCCHDLIWTPVKWLYIVVFKTVLKYTTDIQHNGMARIKNKLGILVYSRILSWKMYSPTHFTKNHGLFFGTVNCPELRMTNRILVLLIRVKYVHAKRVKFAPVYSICHLMVWLKWERIWHAVQMRAGTLSWLNNFVAFLIISRRIAR